MIIFQRASDLKKYLSGIRNQNLKIGFVPTMGALHAGHLSLVKTSREQNDITLTSIFVNPRQFNNAEDFEKYPITVEEDILELEQAGTDILFLPGISEIYPDDASPARNYDLGELENILEGKFRPGHFQGVCNVMDKLMHITEPDRLYLGQKDFQQVMVIRRLLQRLQKPAEVITVPIMREKNGLAMSSRNQRLPAEERNRASAIYQQLLWIKENQHHTHFENLKDEAIRNLKQKNIDTEYLALCCASDLSRLTDFDSNHQMILLIAVYLNGIRLIDNMIL